MRARIDFSGQDASALVFAEIQERGGRARIDELSASTRLIHELIHDGDLEQDGAYVSLASRENPRDWAKAFKDFEKTEGECQVVYYTRHPPKPIERKTRKFKGVAGRACDAALYFYEEKAEREIAAAMFETRSGSWRGRLLKYQTKNFAAMEAKYGAKKNPSSPAGYGGAKTLYKKFHKFEPRKESFANLKIPEHVYHVGEAEQVLYRSDKLNPTTLEDEGTVDYFHDHNRGVKMYLAKADGEGVRRVAVPKRIRETEALVVLGKCLGFTFRDFAYDEHTARGKTPFPELVALPPSGRVLLVVQNRRTVLAMMWGGKLSVKPEGITG